MEQGCYGRDSSDAAQLHVPKEIEVVFRDKANPDVVPEPRPNIARQLYLKPRDFELHGLTRGCPKCDYFLKYAQWGTKPHSTKCRERITGELAKDPAGQRRIAAASSRLDIIVEQLGEPLRADRHQGERIDAEHVVVPDQPEVVPPSFLPMPEAGERPA